MRPLIYCLAPAVAFASVAIFLSCVHGRLRMTGKLACCPAERFSGALLNCEGDNMLSLV